MELNSRAIGLMVSSIVAIITTAFLNLVEGTNVTILLIAFSLSLSSTYILVRLVLEFLFFRHINNIYDALGKINRKDLNLVIDPNSSPLNPMKRINTEIYSFAQNKQREIAELKKMESFRREFMADVSHELKTPIFAAQGFVHTLLDGAIEDKKVRTKFLKKAAKSLDGLDMLVHDLLTLSQIETGEIKMHVTSFSLKETIEEVYDQLENKANKKGLNLTFKKAKGIFVLGDSHRIYQALLNLVSNAIKYTDKGGKIKIGYRDEEDHITIYVKDTGQGIPEEDIHRIFERFYRVDKSRSKEKGGTGLGLAIVKHILEGHQSKIEVKSVKGEGSEFMFALKKDLSGNNIELDEMDEY